MLIKFLRITNTNLNNIFGNGRRYSITNNNYQNLLLNIVYYILNTCIPYINEKILQNRKRDKCPS